MRICAARDKGQQHQHEQQPGRPRVDAEAPPQPGADAAEHPPVAGRTRPWLRKVAWISFIDSRVRRPGTSMHQGLTLDRTPSAYTQ